MTTAKTVGASSTNEVSWHSINWKKAHRIVNRLQARIVKAKQEGNHGKVRALQWILTHSFSAKVLAIRSVTRNKGKKTPGVDGETWNTPEKKASAVHQLKRQGYKASPLRRVYIPKKNGKKRPLGIPTMKDRAMQAVYAMALDPIAEVMADPNSYAYRKSRGIHDAIEQVFIILARKVSPEWVYEGDIKACFDGISHEWMLANIPMDKVILQKWLKAGYIEKDVFYKTDAGTPQGGIISPILANLTLDGLEKEMRQAFPKGRGNRKVNLVRFADDFIVSADSQELLTMEASPIVEDFVGKRGLSLSKEKTQITHIQHGFDFLGFNVRKYKGKLLIKPSKKNVKAVLNKIREIIKGNKQTTSGELIKKLNPIIRGWSNNYRHVVSKKTFKNVDSAIFKAIWRWCCRRHPNKGKRWIKKKYFKTIGNRNWVFHGIIKGRSGKEQEIILFSASRIPIKRHIKIRSAANPYDPEWEKYFEKRQGYKMTNSPKGTKLLRNLWKRQKGKCPKCDQLITLETGWNIHRIVPGSKGGTYQSTNLLLLHPICHQQLHYQDNSSNAACS